MASEQVLTLAVRRYVIAGDRPFQDVMDAIYAGMSRPAARRRDPGRLRQRQLGAGTLAPSVRYYPCRCFKGWVGRWRGW